MSNAERFASAAAAYGRLLGLFTADDPDQAAIDAEVAAASAALAGCSIMTPEDATAAAEADRLRALVVHAAQDHRDRLKAAMDAPPASRNPAALRAYVGSGDTPAEARFLDHHS